VLDAVAVCREQGWKNDWVVDLDIRAFFDSVPEGLRDWPLTTYTVPDCGMSFGPAWGSPIRIASLQLWLTSPQSATLCPS
jgi:hypothetical protein